MKIYDVESFGLALRQRRKEMNYTQREISDLTGFSISFISDQKNYALYYNVTKSDNRETREWFEHMKRNVWDVAS